eukprot:2081628-Pyramimonas_sp.AAC.1
MDDDNSDTVHELQRYLTALNARGLDWVAMGDWNMELDELKGPWLEQVRGVPIVPTGRRAGRRWRAPAWTTSSRRRTWTRG